MLSNWPKQFEKTSGASNLCTRIAFLALLLFVAGTALAQPYPSRLGRFQVDQVKGCAPFTVTITNCNLITSNECTGGKPCLMNFEGLGQVLNSFTYTYTTPGTFTLSVLYQTQVGGPDDITITVLPNVQPDFELYTCSARRVTVNVTDKTYDKYYIDFGDGSPLDSINASANQVDQHQYAILGNYNISVHGRELGAADNCNAQIQSFTALTTLPAPKIDTVRALDPSSFKISFTAAPNLQLRMEIATDNSTNFQLFQTLYGVSNTIASGLALDQSFYCFRLSAYDPCTGINKYSPIVCSQKFSAIPQNMVNALSWITPAAGVKNYSLTRDGNAFITTPLQNFDDNNIVCNTTYCYQVTTIYFNGSRSISLTKCIQAIRTDIPTIINNTSAVVSDTQVELTWLQDPAFVPVSYSILRSQNSGSATFFASVTSPLYDDPSYSTDGVYCYRIVYTDLCGNSSPLGDLICPMRLSGTIDRSNVVTLQWSDYSGWANGVKSYRVDKYNPQGGFIKSFSVGIATTYQDIEVDLTNQVVSYQVVAIPNDPGMINSISNNARFVKSVNLFYPTAFTPNGDALNDGFMVTGQYIAKLELNIFDRWGSLIYSTDSNVPWDGTYNGKLMPESTYVWTAKVTDVAGQNLTHNGTVILFNKKK